jgi:hypothetical protein
MRAHTTITVRIGSTPDTVSAAFNPRQIANMTGYSKPDSRLVRLKALGLVTDGGDTSNREKTNIIVTILFILLSPLPSVPRD